MLALCLAFALRPVVQTAELTPGILRVGFGRSIFLGVNQNDAQAAFKAFLETVGRKRGYRLELRTEIFDDGPSLAAAIRDGTITLASIDSWSYLAMNLRGTAKPFFVSTEKAKPGKKYVVLTRQESGLKTLDDLRGKEIVELDSANANLGRPWLETLLLEHGLGTPESFFGAVEVVSKASAAVLPVFFGKKHACLVDQSGFEVMKELNPQVGKSLRVVAISETFVNNIICLSETGWSAEQYKADVVQALGELHLEPAGQQILMLFKSDRLLPFQEDYLDTVRRLRATYDRTRRQASP